MTNLFNEEIKDYDPNVSYALHDKVIFNFEVYYSLINPNNLLPSTGNYLTNASYAVSLNKVVGNTWQKL